MRGASVEEARNIWKINKEMDEQTGKSTAQSLDELLDELEKQKLIMPEEKEIIKDTGKIKIGSRTIEFTEEIVTEMDISKTKIGDYIKYSDKLTEETYTSDANETGYEEAQTFVTDKDMMWQVIDKDEETGKVSIVATKNILANDNTTGLYLVGDKGFLNAEKVLKDLCETLYSSEKYGIGRSIKIEDINKLTGFDPSKSDFQGVKYLTKYTLSSGGPYWNREKNTYENATEENKKTITVDAYNYGLNDAQMDLYDVLSVANEGEDWSQDEGNFPRYYWIATRAEYYNSEANIYYNYVMKTQGDRNVGIGGFIWSIVNSLNKQEFRKWAFGVRPIVTLNSNVKIDITDKLKDGSTMEKAYILK